jgi:hypothetical protein
MGSLAFNSKISSGEGDPSNDSLGTEVGTEALAPNSYNIWNQRTKAMVIDNLAFADKYRNTVNNLIISYVDADPVAREPEMCLKFIIAFYRRAYNTASNLLEGANLGNKDSIAKNKDLFKSLEAFDYENNDLNKFLRSFQIEMNNFHGGVRKSIEAALN